LNYAFLSFSLDNEFYYALKTKFILKEEDYVKDQRTVLREVDKNEAQYLYW
jgi:hypothetical protein